MRLAAPWMELALVAAAGVFFLYSVSGWAPSGTYSFDESDYLFSCERGMLAHWLDRPSLSLAEFAAAGWKNRQPENRKVLSELVRSGGYIDFYRHWHGPLYYYWLAAVSFPLRADEQAARQSTLFFHGLTFCVMWWGVRRLRGVLAAVLCSGAYLISYTNVNTASQLAPHALFVLLFVIALLALAFLRQSGERKWWYVAVVATALAFATLEVALVLVATLMATCWLERDGAFAGWRRAEWMRFALRSVGLFVAVALVVWPAGIYKLNFLKGYAMMAFLSVFRKAAWGTVTVAETWVARVAGSPVEWIWMGLGLAAGLWWMLRGNPRGRILAPMAVYGALMLAVLFKVATDEPRYQAPFMACLQMLGGLVLADGLSRFSKPAQWGAAAAALLLLAVNAWPAYDANRPKPESPWRTAIAGMAGRDLEGKTVLIPQRVMPVFRYYLRQVRWRTYVEGEDSAQALSRILEREPAVGLLRQEDGVRPLSVEMPGRFPEAVTLSRTGEGGRLAYYVLGEGR